MNAQAAPTGFTSMRTTGPAVKICGVMRPEHARLAAECGADMIGVVFARSRRQLSVEAAKDIRKALDNLEKRPLLVGVFVNETPQRIREIAREVGLDVIQLSGDETPSLVAECAQDYPVIKAVRFPSDAALEEALGILDSYVVGGSDGRIRLLVDAHQPGEYGGTGQVADWSLAAQLASQRDIILAGGLNPSNVAEAIRAVPPWGVDVSSGVESGGVKDPGLIEEFIASAKQTDRALDGAARICHSEPARNQSGIVGCSG